MKVDALKDVKLSCLFLILLPHRNLTHLILMPTLLFMSVVHFALSWSEASHMEF